MIDLHTHTTVSDGGDSPRALAKAAAMANLSVVAVTDHDNDSGCTEAVEEEAGGRGSQIGRPHFAAVLVRHGAVPDYQSAFDTYLAKGAKAYIGRKLFKPAEATKLMLSAGVVPVLAHPHTLQLEPPELESFVDELTDAGLKGIEGYHGDLPIDDQEPYRALGRSRGLVVSGGSDYHGHMRPDRALPGGQHGVAVPDGVNDDLRDVSPPPAP